VALKDFIALAVVGAVLIAVGFAMWSPPVGMAVAGVETVGAAYVGAYLEARKREQVKPR